MKKILDALFKREKQKNVSALCQTWSEVGQQKELEYHITSEWRRSGDFMPQTRILFEGFGFMPCHFSGKTILDVGAGSQLRTLYFENAEIIALEPLGKEFIKKVDNQNLDKASKLISEPAEKFIAEIEGKIDFVISINVLDHCYNFDQIVNNIYLYMKNKATAFFSFDSHETTDECHPLYLQLDNCLKIFEQTGFYVERYSTGMPDNFFEKYKTHTYGHGEHCLNFWLSK